MSSFPVFPKNIQEKDGSLKSSIDFKEDSSKKLNCSYAQFIINHIKDEVKQNGDRVYILDAGIGEYIFI